MPRYAAFLRGVSYDAAFMTMLEKIFGTKVTTRTWETVRKCAAA